VIKSGNEREPFDRGKIERSSPRLPQARNPSGTARPARFGIQRQVETLGDAEIPSSRIGEMVMDGLRQLDSVAYIRFASVYRDFSEARISRIRQLGADIAPE